MRAIRFVIELLCCQKFMANLVGFIQYAIAITNIIIESICKGSIVTDITKHALFLTRFCKSIKKSMRLGKWADSLRISFRCYKFSFPIFAIYMCESVFLLLDNIILLHDGRVLLGSSMAIKKFKYVASICACALKYFHYMREYYRAAWTKGVNTAREKQMALLEIVVGFVKGVICLNKLRILDIHYYISKTTMRVLLLCCCWLVGVKMILYKIYGGLSKAHIYV